MKKTKKIVWVAALACLGLPCLAGEQTPASGWTPKELGTDLWGWWDASREEGVSLDDKGQVKAVQDRSGHDRNLAAEGRDIRRQENMAPLLGGVRLWMPLAQDLRAEPFQKLKGPGFETGKEDWTVFVVWSRLRYPKKATGGPPEKETAGPILKAGGATLLSVGKDPLRIYAFGKADDERCLLADKPDLCHVYGAALVKKGGSADLWLNGQRVREGVPTGLGDGANGELVFSDGASLGFCEMFVVSKALSEAEIQKAWDYLNRWELGKRRWLGILSAGQSNAGMMSKHGGYGRMAGIAGKLNGLFSLSLEGTIDGASSQGTYHGGTSLVGGFMKLSEGADPWNAASWSPTGAAQDCVAFWRKSMEADPAFEPAAFFWFQGETDIKNNPNFNKENYKAGVVQLADYFRRELNLPDLPFIAPNLHTFGYGSSEGHLQIRQIYKELEEMPGNPHKIHWLPLNAFDIDDDNDKPGSYGGAHMSAADCQSLGGRLGYTLAWKLRKLGIKGAGAVEKAPTTGPQALSARRLSDTDVEITVRHDFGDSLRPLSAIAAGGAGWSWTEGGGPKEKAHGAQSCEIMAPDKLKVAFKEPLPAKALVWYGRGWCRLGGPDNLSGHGNSIYDNAASKPLEPPVLQEGSRVDMPLQPTLYGVEVP